MRESGYGIGWFVSVTEDDLRVVQHSGGTLGVKTILSLVPEENLAAAVLSNTDSQWPSKIAIEILCTLLSRQPEEFSPPADSLADEPSFAPGPELVGFWEGFVHTYEGDIPLALEIEESGTIHTTLGEQPRTPLRSMSYQDDLPLFLNVGGGPFLRGLDAR